jgi:Na+/proline symporter
MLSGLVVSIVWLLFLYKGVVGPVATWVYPVVPAIAVALPLFFIVSFLTKKPPKEVLDLLG